MRTCVNTVTLTDNTGMKHKINIRKTPIHQHNPKTNKTQKIIAGRKPKLGETHINEINTKNLQITINKKTRTITNKNRNMLLQQASLQHYDKQEKLSEKAYQTLKQNTTKTNQTKLEISEELIQAFSNKETVDKTLKTVSQIKEVEHHTLLAIAALSRNPTILHELAERSLQNLQNHNNKTSEKLLSNDPETQNNHFNRQNELETLITEILKNEHTSAKTLTKLKKENSPYLNLFIGMHKNLPKNDLENYIKNSHHNNIGTLGALKNPNLTKKQLKQILRKNKPDSGAWESVANHKNTPETLQKYIMENTLPDSEVWGRLAENENLHPNILTALLNQSEPGKETRYYLAKNQKLTSTQLNKIMQKASSWYIHETTLRKLVLNQIAPKHMETLLELEPTYETLEDLLETVKRLPTN